MNLLKIRPIIIAGVACCLVACGSQTGDDAGDDGTSEMMTSTSGEMTSGAMTGGMTNVTNAAEGDSSGSAEADTGMSGLVEINVTVNYEGMNVDPALTVAASTTFPATTLPVAFTREMMPTFPWSGTLTEVEPGEYYIVAVIDVGADDPAIPGDEDIQVATEMPIDFSGPGPFDVELTVTDP